jgi:hypothetical protein
VIRQVLPLEVKSALIDVCERSFWYKQPLFDMFARAGIPEEMYLKYEHEPKFKIARQLIADLELGGDDGYLLQRRLLSELCRLRRLPDTDLPDRDAGLEALRRLKAAAREHDLGVDESRAAAGRRTADAGTGVQSHAFGGPARAAAAGRAAIPLR